MTIQLVQPSQFDAQIQSECFSTDSDKICPRNRKKYPKSHEDQFSTLYQADQRSEQQEHKNPIYSSILAIILYMIKFYLLLKINMLHLYYEACLAIDRWSNTDNQCIEHYFNQLKVMDAQIPRHVCVVSNENLTNETKISLYSNVIDSLSVYGVEAITFYQFSSISIKVKEYLKEKYLSRDENNNSTKQKNVNVNFLSIESGGNCVVVSACKSIASKIIHNQIELNNVSQDLVNSQVIELSDMIEPQMILLVGNEDNLYGFCSWHLRLSEIIKIPSHKLVNRISIRNALIRYNKIEKRMSFRFESTDLNQFVYLLVKIQSDKEKLNLEQIEVQIIMTQALTNLFGEIGMIGMAPKILKFDSEKLTLVLETEQKYLQELIQALSLTNGISTTNPYKLNFKILNVTNYLTSLDVNSQNEDKNDFDLLTNKHIT
ncbi:dehydrodolichyl diphosphate syntase complex subunit NUS1 [Brachionus plicatilis]|uniref:ditrans,polycis-polyprenyl diphosphate synthase [(2E,6E)-farnesyldiphosphate specific] n=1 Tax=Brachionus plicatilis TaxID=10195 RepID=A0A3M7T499_BRAPC|nr:dehydrodolichyl diphosphate syntase complex subunit NUS1 [Brachionus plicatilis]